MRKLLYGKITLHSEFCEKCQSESFIINGKFRCCGSICEKEPTAWKRMSATARRRPHWTVGLKEKLIDEQSQNCFWCGISFFRQEFRNGFPAVKTIHIEHIEPFVFSADDSENNIVASCSICNQLKHDLMFKDIYECREYIQIHRTLKGYSLSGMSPLREAICAKTKVAGILHERMPLG